MTSKRKARSYGVSKNWKGFNDAIWSTLAEVTADADKKKGLRDASLKFTETERSLEENLEIKNALTERKWGSGDSEESPDTTWEDEEIDEAETQSENVVQEEENSASSYSKRGELFLTAVSTNPLQKVK